MERRSRDLSEVCVLEWSINQPEGRQVQYFHGEFPLEKKKKKKIGVQFKTTAVRNNAVVPQVNSPVINKYSRGEVNNTECEHLG